MARKTIEVTPEQVRLAKTKVEADAKSGRTSDPMLVLVAKAGDATARRFTDATRRTSSAALT